MDRKTNPRCNRYGKIHVGKCLAGSDAYFGYGKMSHRLTNYHDAQKKGQEGHSQGQMVSGVQAQPRTQ